MLGGFVGQLGQQQHLREGVVFAGHAFLPPAAGNLQQLGEEPGAGVALVVPEVFFQHQAGQAEIDLLLAAVFQAIQGVHAALADDGGHFGFGGQVLGGQHHARASLPNAAESCSDWQVVAVADHAREGDLAGAAALDGAHVGRRRAGFGVRCCCRSRG